MKILQGMTGLLASRKGTLSLIVFAGSLVANLSGHLSGEAFATVVSIVASIFHISHVMDQKLNGDGLPDRGKM